MQHTSSNRVPAKHNPPLPAAIDVDQFYKKYEYDSEDDGIQAIDAKTFREGVRKDREKKRASTSAAPPTAAASANVRRASQVPNPTSGTIFRQHLPNPSVSVNAIAGPSQPRISVRTLPPISPPPRRIPTVDHPSQIGDAIQHLRQKQHQQTSYTPQPAESATPRKRRKLNTPPTPVPMQSTQTHVMTTIPVGPPGRRFTLSTMVVAEDSSQATRPKSVDKGKDRLAPPVPPPSLPPPPPMSTQIQGTKRIISDVIELSSDGEEIHKSSTPVKKKQKQGQAVRKNPVVRSLSPIEIDFSDHEKDVVKQPVPQSAVDLVSKCEDTVMHELLLRPPGSSAQGLPEPAATLPESEQITSADYDDGDEESDWDPYGQIHDSSRWNSSTYHLEDEEDEANNLEISRLSINNPTSPTTPPRSIHPNTSKWTTRPPRKSVASPVEFVWDKLRAAKNVHVRPRVRTQRALTMPSYVRPWNLDFDLHMVKLEHSFKRAPGSINKIEQQGPWTAIASASFGGLPDSANDEHAIAHNRPGSLLTWGPGGLDMPSGHMKLDQSTRTPSKHYAVHDVKFDPLSTTIVSSGADCKIRLWNLDDQADDEVMGDDDENGLTPSPEPRSRWTNNDVEKYKRVPHDIIFNPGSSIMAVAEKRCHIYKIADAGDEYGKHIQRHHNFLLHTHIKAPHIVGSMVWGVGPTKDRLFVSSEPDPERVADVDAMRFEGVHRVYDVEKTTFVCDLSAGEAGDTMALDAAGATLALSTRGATNTHLLRLYDVKRMRPRPSSAVQLVNFPLRHDEFEGEVNSAAFSPDNIYLALARNDNHVHVYDVRNLVRGPVLDYKHGNEKESRVPGVKYGVYGIVKAQWAWSEATRRTALVSGGEDGCVRLWNPLLAGENKGNGICVARMNSDVAHFSIGDRWAGEHRLVVGDSAGEVMIFNNIVI